jgi:hypothetical protein
VFTFLILFLLPFFKFFHLLFYKLIFFFFLFISISVIYIIKIMSASLVSSPVRTTIPQEKTFGKVTMMNSDGSVVSSGTIVPEGERTQMFGRIHMNPILKIKSDEDGTKYDQAAWIAKYGAQVKRESVYASDPVAAKSYAEGVQKAMNDATTPRLPQTPRPRPTPPPVRRTVFGIPQPPPSLTPLNLAPPPFKFDLPPLPPMITPPPRLI